MTKSTEHPRAIHGSDISASSLVEKDLVVSWDTIGSEYDWYRVESICTPVDCASMGVDSDKCPSMTVVSTVVAQNLEELCNSLVMPKLNAPMSAKVLSVQKYSRSYLKQNNQPDQCNVLEDVEFCQVPECQYFCLETFSSFARHEVWTGHSMEDQEPRRGFWDDTLRFARKNVLKNIKSRPLLENKRSEFLSALEFDHFYFEGSGSVEISGSSYVVSPAWSFEGQGSAQVLGSLFMSFEYEPRGSLYLSGSSDDLRLGLAFDSFGSVYASGSACCVSPSFNGFASGGVYLSGAAVSPLLDMGIFEVRLEATASAFDMGYEYMEDFSSSSLSISDFTVSACGCQSVAPIIFLRHNLLKSAVFERFISSENIDFPDQMPMRYREDDNSWRFHQKMSGREGFLLVYSSLSCISDSWRLDFGIEDGLNRTRIALEMPLDIICSDTMKSLPMLFYFSSFSSESGSGERIPAVNPVRKKSVTIYGKVDSFVNGVFVPETVYYDELGVFADYYWSYAPFELRINPPSVRGTKTIDLKWVT